MNITTTVNRRAFLRGGLALAGAAAMAPLALATEPKISTPIYNRLSLEEEAALGTKFAAELEKKVEVVHNPIIDVYLRSIVQKLGANSQAPYWPYRVSLVNSPVVNAFTLPGGVIYVQRGLIEMVETEAELVGALAHEVGHAVARHATNGLMLTFIARNLYNLVKKNLLGENSVIARIIEQLGGPIVMLAQLKYSREQETEADLLGFYEMFRAGWHPNGLVKFFERMDMREHNKKAVIFSDHPASIDRARAIQGELEKVVVPETLREQSIQFQLVKATLGMIPAPAGPEKRG